MIIEIIGTLICVWIIIVFIRFFYEFFNFKNYSRNLKKMISWCEENILGLPPRKEFVK